MLKWTPNSDNTKYHLEKSGENVYCILSGGVWRVEVWIQDHCKINAWAGKAMDTHLEDVQALSESMLDLYREWKK